MGLQGISPQQKRPAVRQLDMRHLQLGALAAQHRKILAPVKLERLASLKDQRHKGSVPRRLLLLLSIRPPYAGKGSNPAVGPGVAQLHQVIMQLLRGPPLLARLPGLGLQPARQFCREGIKLARSLRNAELRLNCARPQILANASAIGLEPMASNGFDARQLRPPRDLPNGQMLPQCPTPNNTQKCHADHSKIPCCQQPRGRCHMGQFSMKITPLPGSLLGANQQLTAKGRFQRYAPRHIRLSMTRGILCPAEVATLANALICRVISPAYQPWRAA